MHLIQLVFAFFLLSALGCATEAPAGPGLGVSDRIWKGSRADIAEYPYLVSVHRYPKKGPLLYYAGVCGGSIISERFILTAAHCLMQRDVTFDPASADQVKVIANRSQAYPTDQDDQEADVENIYFHPHANITPPAAGHRRTCIDNDVAIVKLTQPLTLGLGIQVIPLAKANTKLRVNTEAKISGYGLTIPEDITSLPSGQLHAATVQMADDLWCHNCYADAPMKNIICAGGVKDASGALSGDSGGPLVVNGVLEGITSCGSPPNNPYNCPNAFARVADSGTRAFIKQITSI